VYLNRLVKTSGRPTIEPLARSTIIVHILSMVGRPCKPNADLKWIWQTLLPGVPLPACGSQEKSDNALGESDRRLTDLTDLEDNAEPRAKCRVPSR